MVYYPYYIIRGNIYYRIKIWLLYGFKNGPNMKYFGFFPFLLPAVDVTKLLNKNEEVWQPIRLG